MELSEKSVDLLDCGATVVIFRNRRGSYTAAVVRNCASPVHTEVYAMEALGKKTVADDITPGKALHLLSEQILHHQGTKDTTDGRD